MKKAQLEIFGLLIIVMLIVVIALFALRFMFITQPSNNQDQVLSIKANNLINALLKVNIDTDIKEENASCCISNINCNIIEDKISKIIENSIEENYEFKVLSNDQDCLNIDSITKCEFGISSSSYIDNIEGIKHEFSILLCKK